MDLIEKYFNAEKYESLIFVLVGIVAITFASYFLIKLKQPFYNGMAYPLMAVAIIQIVVGSSVYLRSSKDIERVSAMVLNHKEKIETEEIQRMEVVMKNFKIYRWIEIGLLLVGIVLFYYFDSLSIWKGVGFGLSIQSAFMLLLDFLPKVEGKVTLTF